MQRTLIDVVRSTPGITLFEQHTLVDLITTRKLGLPGNRCLGLYALDSDTDEVVTFRAPQTILATGGAGKVYLYTTNPDTATGDGIAAAWRAGCRVANMEFIQFPPRACTTRTKSPSSSAKAVRGEGGKAVAAAIGRWHALHARPRPTRRTGPARRGGPRHRLRDEKARPRLRAPRHLAPEPRVFAGALPNILAHCASLGIDITKEPIPVVPTAHFTCGGVLTDLAGRTDLPGLYAVGEVACTGLHGANRLASNSLLECMVFARAAALAIAATLLPNCPPCPPGTTAA